MNLWRTGQHTAYRAEKPLCDVSIDERLLSIRISNISAQYNIRVRVYG